MKVPFKDWKSVEFDSWFWTNTVIGSTEPFSKEDVEGAYIAGFNTCRDKWGGMDYKETVEWQKALFGEMLK